MPCTKFSGLYHTEPRRAFRTGTHAAKPPQAGLLKKSSSGEVAFTWKDVAHERLRRNQPSPLDRGARKSENRFGGGSGRRKMPPPPKLFSPPGGEPGLRYPPVAKNRCGKDAFGHSPLEGERRPDPQGGSELFLWHVPPPNSPAGFYPIGDSPSRGEWFFLLVSPKYPGLFRQPLVREDSQQPQTPGAS